MKNKNIILIFLLLNSQFLIAQPQNRTWAVAAQFDDNLIKFNPAPVVNGLLCPNASFLSKVLIQFRMPMVIYCFTFMTGLFLIKTH